MAALASFPASFPALLSVRQESASAQLPFPPIHSADEARRTSLARVRDGVLAQHAELVSQVRALEEP